MYGRVGRGRGKENRGRKMSEWDRLIMGRGGEEKEGWLVQVRFYITLGAHCSTADHTRKAHKAVSGLALQRYYDCYNYTKTEYNNA